MSHETDKGGSEEDPGSRKTRFGVGFFYGLLALVLVVFGIAGIATPKFAAARPRANTRACFANQKTLMGAIEMYNLDNNTKATDLASVAPTLIASGYLMQMSDDPGQGAGTFKNYSLILDPTHCKVHGPAFEHACDECRKHPGAGIVCSVHGPVAGAR